MKIEFLHHYHRRHGLPLRERLIAWLPRYAPYAARLRGLMNLRDRLPGAAGPERAPARPRRRPAAAGLAAAVARPAERRARDVAGDGRDLVLFADTFNRYFEPGNLAAAERVLAAAGYRLHRPPPPPAGRSAAAGPSSPPAASRRPAPRPAARSPRSRPSSRAAPASSASSRPACSPSATSSRRCCRATRPQPLAGRAPTCSRRSWPTTSPPAGQPAVRRRGRPRAHLHGHCHQKAFGAHARGRGGAPAASRASTVRPIESSCCGMAGAFGYRAETCRVSMAMAELALLPAVRAAGAGRRHRRERHELPPPDRGRRRPHRPAPRGLPGRGSARRARGSMPAGSWLTPAWARTMSAAADRLEPAGSRGTWSSTGHGRGDQISFWSRMPRIHVLPVARPSSRNRGWSGLPDPPHWRRSERQTG